MKTAPLDYILRIVQQTNILPVTSSCGTGCVFCSHKNNPEGIDVYTLPVLSYEEIMNISEFLDRDRKIVIGESASRIMEGEPFIRKDMVDILRFLRTRFPSTTIEITTSGVFLTDEIVKELRKIEPLELNISLNSSSHEGRKVLFRGRDLWGAVDGIVHLKNNGMAFNGSIVAMPGLIGYEDIENTIAYLCKNGAQTVRVFVPGFSGLSEYKIDFQDIRMRLQQIADSMYELYGVPVLIEPPEIKSLDAEVCGCLKDSPAQHGGLLKGDIILKINGFSPLTRVDAYDRLYKSENPSIEIIRAGRILKLNIEKKAYKSSGAVFYYDIHPDTVYSIENAIQKYRAKAPVVATSLLGLDIVKLGINKLLGKSIQVCGIENKWFGGSIMCAGLLTVGDIAEGIKMWSQSVKPDLIVLPPLPFDMNGRDLSGRYFYEIEEALGIKAVIAE